MPGNIRFRPLVENLPKLGPGSFACALCLCRDSTQNAAAGHAVFYADLGGLLLDPDGRLTPEVSPDRLHFTGLGYARLVPRLDALIDRLLSRR